MRALHIIIALNVYPAVANPIHFYNFEGLGTRDESNSNNGFISPKTWVPIAVIILMLCLVGLMTWSRNSLQHAVAAFGGLYSTPNVGARPGNNPTSTTTRELTAQQLVGSINDPPTSGTARNTRRTRRPRRTPSQISVTSLPPYNKEPGEEELVIFRGRDMEDATMPPATVAEEAEEDDDNSLNSQDNSQVSRYSPMPTTPNNIPLLHNNDLSGDLSLQSMQSADARRPSLDSSLQETSSLMRVDSNVPRTNSDSRGEAPPYFEVIDDTPNTTQMPPSSMPSSTSPEPQQTRRSGFRTFLNRMSMGSHVPEHRRTESDQSFTTSNAHSISSRMNHRPSPSASGSMFRTISRQRSNHTLNSSVRLNSPSLISLNSISAPLAHTLIRTEFTYPKSGPTPQQLKVISSRDNFSRFGVPYGPDAIAFAASSSRQDLEPPPPDFEEALSSPVGPGRSRLDSSVSAADVQEDQPPMSEPALEGEGAEHGSETSSSQPLSTDASSENIAALPKVPDPISPTDPSSSTSTPKLSHVLPSINLVSEFGTLYPSHGSLTTAPQDAHANARSDSRTSNFSFQSYATASESLGMGYVSADSGPSTHIQTVADEV